MNFGGTHTFGLLQGGWPVQNLQGWHAGWRTKEEPVLQFKSKGFLLAEFCPAWERSVFSFHGGSSHPQ